MPNARGNQGYGKTEMIRMNFDKFSPKFWELMETFADSKDIKKQTLFITEFNKIQVKMMPQVIAGDKDNPIPIIYVPSNNSDTKANEDVQENTGSTGGVISEQDGVNPNILDSVGATGQAEDVNVSSVGVNTSSETGSDTGLQEHPTNPQILEGQ
jgi:hypothetical protein